MELDEEFRRRFPNLAKEIEEEKMVVQIDSVRTQLADEGDETLSGYTPDVVDFLRRCDTTEEALEIISFLEKRREISFEQAVRLRAQLKQLGLRSFGSKKDMGHYERLGRR